MIDQKAYLEAIKTPITENKTSKESEEFIFLEEEMTKFSSMRENTLDWKQAEKTAIVLLSEKTKNFRVLAHLLLCLQHDRDAERFILSIQLLNSFVELFWESSEPKIQPPKKELMIKKKILRQILIRTEQATSRLDLTEGDRALTPNLSQAMENLEKVVTKVGLEYEDFWKITTEFEKKLPPEVIVQKKISEPETNTSSPKQTSTDAPSSNSDIKSSELKLDLENERETKQTLFKVATFLNDTFEKEPLGYRLRRFALWFSINSMPPLKKDGNTEMIAIPIHTLNEYNEALINNCNHQLLMSIEQTVSKSPFWVTGSYLSSRVAESLGMNDVHDAILEETSRFIERTPDLLNAKFSDGSPFVDKNTRHWLTQKTNNTSNGSENWQKKLEESLHLAKQGRFKNGLNIIEKGIHSSKQPRDRFYWRLAYANFLDKTGMKSLADEIFSTLNAEIKNFEVSLWEPELFNQLQGKVKTSERQS